MKKALLVGINNYKDPSASLSGCQNDVKGFYKLLTTKYSFEADNIRVLFDDRATKSNIIERLNWLVDGVKTGDSIVFQFSGHGSQVRERNKGNELADGLTELICTYELDWNNPLTDDEIAKYCNPIQGVDFTILFDCCHSGTGTRDFNPHKPVFKSRHLTPPWDIAVRAKDRVISKTNIISTNQNIVFYAACKDNQTAADASFVDGHYGAFTYNLLKVINSSTTPLTNELLISKIIDNLKVQGFDQIPQLEGNAQEFTKNFLF